MTVAKALLLSQYTYVATVLDLSQKESEYIQSILDNFILYNNFLNHGHKSRYWINQDILPIWQEKPLGVQCHQFQIFSIKPKHQLDTPVGREKSL